jgi:O-antigen/teichoic acid export membrane protein
MDVHKSRNRGRIRRAFHLRTEDLSERTLNSAGFAVTGAALRTFITIASTAVLARLLSPADFGHVAMATVVTEFALILGNLGIVSILIQRVRISRLQLETGFWTSLAIGAALAVLVLAGSVPAALFFKDPLVGELLRVLSLMFILESLTAVQVVVLSRLMLFRLDMILQVGMVLLRAATAIVFALFGFGVWSLVLGSFAGRLVTLLIGWAFVPFVPRMKLDLQFLRDNWKTAISYFGTGVVFYLQNNFDLMVVGRRLGAADLGFYQGARSLADELRNRITAPIRQVLFPAYAALQGDRRRFQSGARKSIRLLALVVVPVGFGMAALAEEVVTLLYGTQWLAMIPLLQIIAVAGAVRAVFSATAPIYNATNRVSLAFAVSVFSTAVFFASIFVGSQWGSRGIAWAFLAASVTSPLTAVVAFRLIGLRARDVFAVSFPALLAGATMWLVVEWARHGLTGAHFSVLQRALILIPTGAAAYVALMLLVARKTVMELVSVISNRLPWRRGA